MKKALIIGAAGQDGTLLFRHLKLAGYDVTGLKRGDISLTDISAIKRLVGDGQFNEIYYLAAFHSSSQEVQLDLDELVIKSKEVNSDGVLNFLQAVEQTSIKSRLFYASSSHIFGHQEEGLQDENTVRDPQTPYAVSKVAGMEYCHQYRQRGVFASVGILYNHESPLRNSDFVSKKIVRAAVAIFRGKQQKLVLGNLDAKVDWGCAEDFVEAMNLALLCSEPQDFVISTGEEHSVREFAQGVFEILGLDFRDHIEINEALVQRRSVRRIGSYKKIHNLTGWKPKTSFKQMLAKLVQSELALLDGK